MKRLDVSRKTWFFAGCCLVLTVFAGYPSADSQAASWSISAEEWARPRSGQSLIQMPALIATLQAFNSASSSLLVIRYPGGEEGALWASELRDWLVSLGIPSVSIEIQPGQSSHENITLTLHTR